MLHMFKTKNIGHKILELPIRPGQTLGFTAALSTLSL